ncbi:hypothetical protein U3516DRAFT_782943 [Neocallimastix sp. 'constans']
MNKVSKCSIVICCFVFGMVVATIAILIYVIGYAPLIPSDYTSKVETGGDIEEKYLKNGNYSSDSYDTLKIIGKNSEFLFFYPDEMKLPNNTKTYPVVVYLNGGGVFVNKLKPLLKHLASWGFIVLGYNELDSTSGLSVDKRINHLMKLNEDENSEFYKKVDINNIGITGHSNGALGVFNAINSNTTYKSYFKCVVSISLEKLSNENEEILFKSAKEIKIPILMLYGTLKENYSLDELMKIYNDIPVTKVFARKINIKHSQMLYNADGYVTAWLMYYLQNDEEAGQFFRGSYPELLNNTLYQDQNITIHQIIAIIPIDNNNNYRTIQLNPLIASTFQVDFNGDEMNIYWLPDTLTGIYNIARDNAIGEPSLNKYSFVRLIPEGILLDVTDGNNQSQLLDAKYNNGNNFYLKFMWDVQRMQIVFLQKKLLDFIDTITEQTINKRIIINNLKNNHTERIQTLLPKCYIKNSYLSGLSSKELLIHSKSGRFCIISSSLKLVKSMEDLVSDTDILIHNNRNNEIFYYIIHLKLILRNRWSLSGICFCLRL